MRKRYKALIAAMFLYFMSLTAILMTDDVVVIKIAAPIVVSSIIMMGIIGYIDLRENGY